MKKFLTTVHSEDTQIMYAYTDTQIMYAYTDTQIMYAYTDTREEGLLKALGYIATFDSNAVPYLKDPLVINQKPNTY